MNSPLPPDPYKILGVAKDAKLPEIRSAHRKLVLKCHPDKVQDAALKAVKQDEFQQVQQAYEILSDDTKRQNYDDKVKLHELRAEMSRGNPTPRSNPFEYEVKTASPRANSFARTAPKVYSTTAPPRSHEDLYDEPVRHTPKKSTSYESATDRDRKRPSARDDERREANIRRYAEEERIRVAAEKAREKERTSRTHSDKKKSRDKEKRSRTEEKTRSRGAYVEGDSSDDESFKAAMRERDRRQRQLEAEIAHAEAVRAEKFRAAEAEKAEKRAQIKEAPLAEKWDAHRDIAAQYMQAARRKGAPAEDEHFHTPPPLRRAETSQPQSSPQYNVRYATVPPAQYSEEDTARRSSGYKESRRSSDTPKREKARRRSPEHPVDPYEHIVEPVTPSPATGRIPTLQKHSSAPPQLPREKPSRARTQDYTTTREGVPPMMPRSQTFTADSGRGRNGSKLKNEYASAESDSDSPKYTTRVSQSPRRAEPMVYRVSEGRSHPMPSRSHRSELRDLNEPSYERHRSPSPRSTPRHERPPITRSPPTNEYNSGEYRASAKSYNYPVPEPPHSKPAVISVTPRPKLAREGSGRSYSSTTPQNAQYGQVKYAPTYEPAQVKTADYPGAAFYNSGRGQSDRDYYSPSSHHRSREQPIYG